MPAKEELYVLVSGEGEGEDEGWLSPRSIDDGVVEVVTDETDLDDADLDDVEAYVELSTVERFLDDADEGETLSFTVEGHDFLIDAAGHVRLDEDEDS